MKIATLEQIKTALHDNRHGKEKADRRFLAFLVMALAVLLCAMPETAMAAPWDGAAQKVIDMFNGGLARTLAVIAVIVCGLLAFGGKLSASMAINIVVGIVFVFGASAIVDFFIAGVSA